MTETSADPTAQAPESRQRLKTAAWALPALIAILAAIVLIEMRWSRDVSFAITLLLVTAVSVVFAYETLSLGSQRVWTRRRCLRMALAMGLVPLALGVFVSLLEPTGYFTGPTEGVARRSVLIPLAAAPTVMLATCLIFGVVRREGDAARVRLSTAFALYGVLALATVPLTGRISSLGILPFAAVMLTVMVSDSAAYFVGRNWGRRKLAPRLSPKKTWEGFVAGLLGAGATLLLLWSSWSPWILWISADGIGAPADPSQRFWPTFLSSLVVTVSLGALVGVVGTLGDLFASWFKRRVDAKDSGTLFPGHGGLLDRTDSLLPNFVLVAAVSSIFLNFD